MAAWFRSRIHSSRFLAGPQWNIPVLSYFISVFSKSKSFAWSSARPTGRATPLLFWFVPPLLLLVGLEQNLSKPRSWNTLTLTCTKSSSFNEGKNRLYLVCTESKPHSDWFTNQTKINFNWLNMRQEILY